MSAAWLVCVVLLAPPAEEGEGAGAAEQEQRSAAYVDVLEPLPEAQRDEAAAKQLMASAKTAFRDERFEEAIEFLAEAYRTYPYVTLLYSLGSAHRRAYEQNGDIEHRRLSVRRYQQYLSQAPGAEYADLAQNYLTALLAERDLGELEAELVTRVLVSTSAEDATMILDGGAPLPAPGMITVEPGRHEILVRAPGYRDKRRSIEVPEGATYQIQAELEGRPAALAVEGPRGAWVRLDGRDIGQLPLGQPISVAPGTHVVGVTKNGHEPYTEDLELEREDSQVVRADLRISNQRVASYFFMGLGGVGLATGAIQLGLALDRQRQAQGFAEQRLDDQLSTQEYERYVELVDQRDALRTGAMIAGLAGGALLVTGVVLFVYDNPRAAPRRGLRAMAPMLGPGGAGAVAVLSF